MKFNMENKKYYIVYCTTNLVNSKIYIGVHKTEDPNKFDGYIGCSVKITMPSTYMNPHTAFQYAVKKYGVKNFKRVVLFVYETAEEAYAKEKELVTSDFIKQDNNYNMIPGGGKDRPTDPIYQFDNDGNLVKSWKETGDAAEFFNCPIKSFGNAILYKEKLFGYFWARENTIDRSKYSNGSPRKPVYKYTKGGKLISEFDSITDCANKENKSTSSIITAIKGECLVEKEFYYSFSLTDEFKPKPRISLRGKKFYLYTLDGKYIRKFENCKELQEFMGVKSFSSIHDVIFRRNGLYKEYQISLEYKEFLPPMENKCVKKAVDVYDKTGNLLETCESVMQAAKKFNVKISSVNRVLRGLANTTGGYIFKFHG